MTEPLKLFMLRVQDTGNRWENFPPPGRARASLTRNSHSSHVPAGPQPTNGAAGGGGGCGAPTISSRPKSSGGFGKMRIVQIHVGLRKKNRK